MTGCQGVRSVPAAGADGSLLARGLTAGGVELRRESLEELYDRAAALETEIAPENETEEEEQIGELDEDMSRLYDEAERVRLKTPATSPRDMTEQVEQPRAHSSLLKDGLLAAQLGGAPLVTDSLLFHGLVLDNKRPGSKKPLALKAKIMSRGQAFSSPTTAASSSLELERSFRSLATKREDNKDVLDLGTWFS